VVPHLGLVAVVVRWRGRGPALADRGAAVYPSFRHREDTDMSAAQGFVVPAGGGKHFQSPTPGRSFALKLLGRETNESIMMFEETLPAGTASLLHLHRDSDEVAWVLAGEFTFRIGDAVTAGGPGTCAFMRRDVPHAWKNTGSDTGRVLFLYTPAAAGGLIEALAEHRPADADEHDKLFERHRWKVVGPNPL
jgi:quercetin dioxygenase-like cupin family protein